MARNVTLAGALALTALLAFLTVSVAIEDGIDLLVVVSLLVLALIGVGILGALAAPGDDE